MLKFASIWHRSTLYVWYLCPNLSFLHMDLRCIVVAMFIHFYHGSALYWFSSMMRNHIMSKKYWCISEAWLMMIFDQAISFLEVINCSFKSLSYHIPLASFFGGNSIACKSCHHHVLRPKTSEISLNSQTMKLDIGLNSHFPYLSPPPSFPLVKNELPSSITPILCW